MRYSSYVLAGIGVVVVAVGVVIYAPARNHVIAMVRPAKPIEITWLIAHEPVGLFNRAADVFEEEFAKESDGKIVIKLLGPKDFGSNTGNMRLENVLDALKDSSAQIATVPTSAIYKYKNLAPELGILNLPFLVETYASAEHMLESEGARKLLSIIDDRTNTHALAFTFSGGLMVLESNNTKIDSADDLKGLRIGTTQGFISEHTLRAWGATPVAISHFDGVGATQAALDAYDAIVLPYARITPESQTPRYITETFHSLFTTTILVDKDFYASLSPANQAALSRAAEKAAKAERQDSIALGLLHRQTVIDRGSTLFVLSPASIKTLKEKSTEVYAAYTDKFGTDILDSLKAAL